jgi:hypothetical protein
MSRQMFDETLVQLANGRLMRVPELHNRLAVGDKGDVRDQTPEMMLDLLIDCLGHSTTC